MRMDYVTLPEIARKEGKSERQADYAARTAGIEPSARIGIPMILNQIGNVAVGTGRPIGELGDILARVAADPVKIISVLDPATQTLEIKPTVLPPAIRAGSAEAQAAEYSSGFNLPSSPAAGPTTDSAVASMPPVPVLPPPPSPENSTQALFQRLKIDPNGLYQAPTGIPLDHLTRNQLKLLSSTSDRHHLPDTAMRHANPVMWPKSAFLDGISRAPTLSERRDEFTENNPLANGNIQIKTFDSDKTPAIQATLTPDQYRSLMAADGEHSTLAERATPAYKRAMAEVKARQGMGLHEQYELNHGGPQPDSITKWKTDWGFALQNNIVTPAQVKAVQHWNTKHEGGESGGHPAYQGNSQNLDNQGNAPQPGGSGPLSATTPAAGSSPSAADSKDQSISLQNANQLLTRIELNTRSSGTGATIVDF